MRQILYYTQSISFIYLFLENEVTLKHICREIQYKIEFNKHFSRTEKVQYKSFPCMQSMFFTTVIMSGLLSRLKMTQVCNFI